MAGLEVPAGANVSVRVQEMLTRAYSTDVAVLRLNLGGSGYEPLRYLLSWRIWQARFKSDITVILFFAGNDFSYGDGGCPGGPDVIRPEEIVRDDRGDPLRVEMSHRLRFAFARKIYRSFFPAGNREITTEKDVLASHPCPGYREQYRVRQFHDREREGLRYNPYAIFKSELTSEDRAVVDDVLNILRMWRDEARLAGSAPLLVVIPDTFQVTNQAPRRREYFCASGDFTLNSRPQELLKGLCAEGGLACLDLLPLWQRSSESLHWPLDLHWNERGHDVTARAIADKIREILGSAQRRTSLYRDFVVWRSPGIDPGTEEKWQMS